MSGPLWLPPLNSHNNFTIKFTLCNDDRYKFPSARDREVYQQMDVGWLENFSTRIKSHVIFFPDHYDDEREKKFMDCIFGLTLMKDIRVAPPTSIGSVISNVLANKAFVQFDLPFEERGCLYTEWRQEVCLKKGSVNLKFYTKHDLIERVSKYYSELIHDCLRSHSIPRYTCLEIKKEIILPREEYNSWKAWWNEQLNRGPEIFSEEYRRAISRPRTSLESTGKSSIDALSEVVVLETKSCGVCLEELSCGQLARKMSCSHEYHEDCIVRWLRTSDTCPLCRCTVPTTNS